jgi:S-adenosylmethionine:tRNA ribosyltransferase-isomerase
LIEVLSFAALVKAFGEMPLPPYMNRQSGAEDLKRTKPFIPNTTELCCPNMGLHFTQKTFWNDLAAKGFKSDFRRSHVERNVSTRKDRQCFGTRNARRTGRFFN